MAGAAAVRRGALVQPAPVRFFPRSPWIRFRRRLRRGAFDSSAHLRTIVGVRRGVLRLRTARAAIVKSSERPGTSTHIEELHGLMLLPKRFAVASAVLLLIALVIAVQAFSGAYVSDFSAGNDEAAHAVSSLLVHDYL